MIGPETWRHRLNQSNKKTKTNPHLVTRVFPRFKQIAGLTLGSHWLMMTFSFALIGRCDHFAFGFTTLFKTSLT